jgi:hypothetical protein
MEAIEAIPSLSRVLSILDTRHRFTKVRGTVLGVEAMEHNEFLPVHSSIKFMNSGDLRLDSFLLWRRFLAGGTRERLVYFLHFH